MLYTVQYSEVYIVEFSVVYRRPVYPFNLDIITKLIYFSNILYQILIELVSSL